MTRRSCDRMRRSIGAGDQERIKIGPIGLDIL
jgi:hypothetical protein